MYVSDDIMSLKINIRFIFINNKLLCSNKEQLHFSSICRVFVIFIPTLQLI